FDIELDRIWGASLAWETEHWQWRISALSTDISDDQQYFPGLEQLGEAYQQIAPYWPEAENYERKISIDKTGIDYLTMGVAYNNAPWQVQAEVARIEPDVTLFPSVNNGYVSVGHQFGPVTAYGMLALASG